MTHYGCRIHKGQTNADLLALVQAHTHKHTHYLQALRLCTDVSAVKFRLLLTSITLDQCNKTMGMQFQSEAWGTCTP